MTDTSASDHTGQSSILLCAPVNSAQETTTCLDLLSVGDPLDERVLFVSFDRSPDELLDFWATHIEEWPVEFGIIAVKDVTRSTGSQSVTTHETVPINVKTVSPTNLTSLGVRVTEFLERWETTDEQIVVCFDSISLLYQHADVDTIPRFLHVLSDHLTAADVRAHFHLDPSIVEDTTLATLKTVVDDVVGVGTPGSSEAHNNES